MDEKYYFHDMSSTSIILEKKRTLQLSYLYGSADRYTVLRVFIMCQYALL